QGTYCRLENRVDEYVTTDSRHSPHISLIVAMDKKGVIGVNGSMPWHLPGDLRWFKENTLGKPIVMGRKTYESIGRALPGRRNLVMTRGTDFVASDAETVCSFEQAVVAVAESDELMVIGGAQIYTL